MAIVSFKTRSGEPVRFKAKPRRRKGKMTPHQKFMSKKMKRLIKGGSSPNDAMEAASRAWNGR